MIVNGNKAVLQKQFLYAYAFSDDATWGGDIKPRAGDAVIVPKGQVLLIDENTPKLGVVIVEGSLIFKDGSDLTFDAHYVLIRHGKF